MNKLDRDAVNAFANREIENFHNARLARLESINLRTVLRRKNPYLFRAKNHHNAADFIGSILDAYLSSSEEELFGRLFLEELAVFVAAQTVNGQKSSAEGIDLEFEYESVHYLVSIKSGPNWGNSSQKRRLESNFRTAVRVQSQSQVLRHIQPVLGICYGKARSVNNGLYIKHVGQSFWHFISDDPDLYLNIIEPSGYQAREHNESFLLKRDALENRFVAEFVQEFCYPDGTIDWQKLVRFNSQNL